MKAIDVIFDTEKHLLICAPTASGKTEAAFMPILSEFADDAVGSVKALYIGPLKALINDQFRRLEEKLCVHADIPVHRWHGDVSSSAKKRLVETPGGVLLITPESIESLFVNRTQYLTKLFSGTRYVVIDEIHSFMGTERGIHLRSLLNRLDLIRGESARRIGLSATVGNPKETAQWMSADDVRDFKVIEHSGGKQLKLIIHGYEKKAPKRRGASIPAEQRLDDYRDVADDIFRTMRGDTNLLFGNFKAELEVYVDLLNEMCRDSRFPEEFLIHHGSLDKAVREHAEHRMQQDDPATTLCTNTLELGIDVGRIDTVGQFDPPFTVSALAQRVGRSGRNRGQASKLRFFVKEETPHEESELWERLFPRLIQSIAMVELLVERWCEPLEHRLHYSTLVQQIMSVLKETGGIQARELYRRLVESGPFKGITIGEFAQLLRRMGDKDLIDQMLGCKDLILGVSGERIVNHFDFYAAFHAPPEFDVRHGSDKIGTVDPSGLMPDDHFILAGRRWEVDRVDKKRKEVIVHPTSGKKEPAFQTSGMRQVHRKVRDRMREVLLGTEHPVFLDEKAAEMLAYARRTAHELDLANTQMLELGADTVLFPWTGDKIIRTLLLIAAKMELETSTGAFNTLIVFEKATRDDVQELIERTARGEFDTLDLVGPLRRDRKEVEKYDQYVPEFLLERAYAENYLDGEGAVEWAKTCLCARQ
jgi:ATP-dependent helicase Lhr and Lhr-like helicase